MTNKQAINLAVNAIKFRIKHIAFDANMWIEHPNSYPYAKKAWEEKQNLLEAIQMLEKMKNEDGNNN